MEIILLKPASEKSVGIEWKTQYFLMSLVVK